MSTDTIKEVLSKLILDAANRNRGLLVGDQQLQALTIAKAILHSLSQIPELSVKKETVDKVVYEALSTEPQWEVARWQDSPFTEAVRALANEILRALATTRGDTHTHQQSLPLAAAQLLPSHSMKYGVLGFRYNSPTFTGFANHLAAEGYYTVNLGDHAQTVAARQMYHRLGINKADVVVINRDSLPTYDGPPSFLIMNGVFYADSFPIPGNITPIFVGFTVHEESVLNQNAAYLKQYEPIGCRDVATTNALNALGIKAFTTGCITLAMNREWQAPPHKKLLIVYGVGAGAFPSDILKYIPHDLLDTAEFLFHRYPMNEFPVSEDKHLCLEQYESAMFRRYSREASLVLTPLHHVAAPCLALGVPVIVCRSQMDKRFTYLEQLMPLYLHNSFSNVDWNPRPLDMTNIRNTLLQSVRDTLRLFTDVTPG